MALKDLQSDLTNLSFGKNKAYDQPSMGFSSEPFIVSPIGGFEGIGLSTTGEFIRGGVLTHARRLEIDGERITKFYASPRGSGFLAKQVGLQLANPQIRPGNITNSPNSNQRTYNLGVNTLAQVVASGTGLHIKREGLLPTSFNGYVDDVDLTIKDTQDSSYSDIGEGNRLLHLFEKNIAGPTTLNPLPSSNNSDENGGFLLNALDFIEGALDSVSVALGGPNPSTELYSYKGGAGSIYGIGQTTIRKYTDTTELNPKYDHLKIPRNIGGISKKNPYYYEGRQGKTSPYQVYVKDPKLNTNFQGILPAVEGAYEGAEDFIPFRFEAVNTDNPLKSDYIVFKAFLDSFNDQFNANHNEINYNGRGESFYTYNNFKRNISFQFKIAAQSKEEMEPLYTKLNYLVSNTAPEYSKLGRIRTPFIKLTVGDWCNRVPGVLNSIGLTWQKDYPWQIENSDNILMLPHVLDVSVQFTPIHNFLPEKSIDSQFFNLKGADA